MNELTIKIMKDSGTKIASIAKIGKLNQEVDIYHLPCSRITSGAGVDSNVKHLK